MRSAGTVHAIYRLGDDMTVRLPLRPEGGNDVAFELRWLPRLAPLLSLTIPAPLARGEPEAGYPCEWSIYRWLDGETATTERIADLREAATTLGQFVAAL
jgi:aminoglycoside phosphotransferase (APT) family kinase protein